MHTPLFRWVIGSLLILGFGMPSLAGAEGEGVWVDEISLSLGKNAKAPAAAPTEEPAKAPEKEQAKPCNCGESKARFRISYLIGGGRHYVVPPSEAALPGAMTYFLGQDMGSSTKAVSFVPYGLELRGRFDRGEKPMFIENRIFFIPGAVRGIPAWSETLAWNLGADLSAGFRLEMGEHMKVRSRLGVRGQFEWVAQGPYPNQFIPWALLGGEIEYRGFEFLFEAGYSSRGYSNVSDFGSLRNALALRARFSYRIALGERWALVPALESTRTHRAYSGGTRMAGLNAFSIEEATYTFLAGFEF